MSRRHRARKPSMLRQDEKMKKRTLAMIAALALIAGASSVLAETATVVITGDALFVTAANVSFTGVTLTGFDQTTTSTSNAWTAEDARGTGLGWHMTIASDDLVIQAQDAFQEVFNDGTGGTFTLTYVAQTTANIAYNATATNIKDALELLSNVTLVGVDGTGVESDPWVIVFITDTGSGIMTADDTLMTGQTVGTTVRFTTIDISEADQQFEITLADVDIVLVDGNTKPTSSVTAYTDIGDATVTFMSAIEGQGMGSYTLDPDFRLEVRAEVYAGTYESTITVASVTGP